jgi:hypothetical protein
MSTADDILFSRISGTVNDRVLMYDAIDIHGGHTADEATILRTYRNLCRTRRVYAHGDAVALQVLRYCRDFPRPK